MIIEYKTFLVEYKDAIATVTFNNPPINIQGLEQLKDLNSLADALEEDKNTKVIIFQSNVPGFFIAHYDIELLKDLSTTPISREDITTSYLQNTLERISNLPQVTIAKIQGICRGGGHEFALACDMRFADENAVFMQMEVGMGILPCGGGSARLARQCGLGKALEIILGARDFDACDAENLGTINSFIINVRMTEHILLLANRIAKFPLESITACKRAVYASIDLPIKEALKEENYQLYQATSQTPAVKRFTEAYNTNFQYDLDNQKHFEDRLMDIQKIK